MPISRVFRIGRVLLISLVFSLTATALMPLLSISERSIAEASVAFDKGDSKEKDKKEKEKEKADNEDRVLNGQVLEIDTLKDPPELIVGSVDGETVIRVLKTDEIALNGIRLGDYIEADGEKLNEHLFEATQLSVSSRYTGEAEEKDKEKDDKKK
jgi:hypothetical protein